MAWKLKKWKGAEAEEEQPEDGVFDISGAVPPEQYAPPQPPAYSTPEPSQAFNASSLAERDVAPSQNPQPGPSVIAMGPAEPEAVVAPPILDAEPNIRSAAPANNVSTQAASVHDLDALEPIAPQPASVADPTERAAAEEAPDYFAESVAHADEAIAAFQDAAASPIVNQQASVPQPPAQQPGLARAVEPEEEPIAFEIEPPGAAVANLHERPVASDPGDLPAAPQSPAAASAPADTMGAFAPYQPVPPGAAPMPAAPVLQGAPPAFEEDLSFAPPFASRLIVKIGPFSATYELDKPEFTIGRPDPKTGNAPDIALEWDDAVSRQHARILRRPEGDYLEDVGSSNGTLLNGQLIAVNTPILLKNDDIITIGERTQISYVR
jgi:hypothetical protein